MLKLMGKENNYNSTLKNFVYLNLCLLVKYIYQQEGIQENATIEDYSYAIACSILLIKD